MAGVIAGLNAAPIDRLKRTKELLSAKVASLKDELDRIMDSSKNFSNYKDMLKTINPPCVPFFGELLLSAYVICSLMVRILPVRIDIYRRRKQGFPPALNVLHFRI